jgi:hypothetical protein
MGPSGLFGNTPTPGIGMGGGALPAGSPGTIGSMAGTSGFGMGGGLPMAAPQQPAPQVAPQPAPQQVSPQVAMMRQQQQQQFRPQQQMGGLQQLLNQMMNRFQPQQRQQRAPMGMPQFRSQALQYRPNMTQAQQSLSRVKPSVQKQEQDANIARIAELEAQLAAQQPQQDPYYGGGG